MLKFEKMRIKKRLTTGFVMVSLITAVSALVAIIAMVIIANRYSYALTNYGFAQGDIGKAMVVFADARSSTRAVISYTDSDIINEAMTTHDEKMANFNEYMTAIESTLTAEDEEAAYEAAMNVAKQYIQIDNQVLALGNTTDSAQSAQAQTMAAEQLDPLYNEVYSNLSNLMTLNVDTGNELSDFCNNLEIILIIVVVLVIAVAIVISVVMGNSVAKGIANPMGELVARLKSFANGDLESDFPTVTSEDEVADMVGEATDMASKLNGIIQDISELLDEMAHGNYAVKSSNANKYVGDFEKILLAMRAMNQQMNETLRHIDVAANQVSAGSTNLSETSQTLAEGATEQAGSVEELQATITDVTEGVHTTAEHVDNSYTQAQQYAKEADRSSKEMKNMVTAMESINETSKKIENIIADIEDIASQTNLLSLNAAIEAARAGEAGKGFAVVADQIRQLAEQSAKSAVDTRQLIEGSIQEISEATKLSENVAATIREVVTGMEQIAESSHKLKEISDEQAASMEQVEIGVNQISVVVQSNAVTAEESAATSEELSAQAASLSDLVGRFTLNKE